MSKNVKKAPKGNLVPEIDQPGLADLCIRRGFASPLDMQVHEIDPVNMLDMQAKQAPNQPSAQDQSIMTDSYLKKEYPGLHQENVGAVLMAILKEIVKGRILR